MSASELQQALNRLDRAIDDAESALAARSTQPLTTGHKEKTRQAIAELDKLINSLNGSRRG